MPRFNKATLTPCHVVLKFPLPREGTVWAYSSGMTVWAQDPNGSTNLLFPFPKSGAPVAVGFRVWSEDSEYCGMNEYDIVDSRPACIAEIIECICQQFSVKLHSVTCGLIKYSGRIKGGTHENSD